MTRPLGQVTARLPRGAAARLPDAALAALVVLIVAMMIIPLPTFVLDFLIAGNITASVLMLLVSLYARDGLSFASMPTVLLVSTLYRLSLNVSSTRLILLQADAGDIIDAFGQFVVRGDYLVGGVVFLVLTLIQYLVVAKGAERVAEVGARFTLDAMPGKQLAIDADLRSGMVGPEQARKQRRELERESQFYGAMDGAMKFVKGDAIAGLAITAINLVAGVAIGTSKHDLGFLESLQRYGLLTIGDGLVSQLPALLVSTAAGVLVTRVAAPEPDATLSRQIGGQLFGDRRVLRAAGAFLLLLAVVPGLPALPFLVLAALTWLGSFAPGSRAATQTAPRPGDALPGPPAVLALHLAADGPQPMVGGRVLLDALGERLRDLGVPAPAGALIVGGRPGHGGSALLLRGRPVVVGDRGDERTGESESGHPKGGGHAPSTAQSFADRCLSAVPRCAPELLDLQTVQRMVDGLEAREPVRVRQSIPAPLTLPVLQTVLKGLVAEGVAIVDLGGVVEAAAGALRRDPRLDDHALLAEVRRALGPAFSYALSEGGVLRIHTLSPLIEETLHEHLMTDRTPPQLATPPGLAEGIIDAVRAQASAGAALVTDAILRPHVRLLLAADLPHVPVLTYAELSPELQVDTAAPIDV